MTKPFINFEGRRILLSGASSGLGRQIASVLAQQKAKLVMLGRNEESLQSVKGTLEGEGHTALAIDLSETDKIISKLQPELEKISPIYGLCHSAGVIQIRPLNSSKSAVINTQMDLNLVAGLELSRLITKRSLADSNGGAIVFISSISSHIGAPGHIGYCASKGAVNAAARAMAIELAPRRFRVNTVSPGFIRTEMTEKSSRLTEEQIQEIIDLHPLGEGKPEDVARAVTFLMDPKNRWISGIDIVVDGALTAQ